MGCPSSCEIEDNLVFSICCHDPDTGVLTDADSAPAYRLYEDETATPILTGTMDKLDDANTTGFYTELIACTAANGFEDGKSYTIYIAATVDSDTGGISYGFKAYSTKADISAIKAKTDNLPSGIAKNVALAKFDFYMVLASDHVTPATLKTVTGEISKDGGSFAAITNAITEVEGGMYTIASGLTQTEMNADIVTLKFIATACDQRVVTIFTT